MKRQYTKNIPFILGLLLVFNQQIAAKEKERAVMPEYDFETILQKEHEFQVKKIDGRLPGLRVHSSGRYFESENGDPIFWLGDTSWGLLREATREEADYYLRQRAANGFNVVQTVALWGWGWEDDDKGENAYGEAPFRKSDTNYPNEKYWEHVDYIVNTAESYGIYIGLLPVWGRDHISKMHFFDEEKAYNYGQFIGNRYKDNRIIWIMGGDAYGFRDAEVYRSLAKGIAVGMTGTEDYSQQLMTFHPRGWYSSSFWFHDDEWLDFNMVQSGHTFNSDTYNMIRVDYKNKAVKPVLDGEPSYENIYHDLKRGNDKIDEHEVRKAAYWAVLAGACGHTYGAHELFLFYKGGDGGHWDADTFWYDAINLPGSLDMKHLKDLFTGIPFYDLIPDNEIVKNAARQKEKHVEAARSRNGNFALFYIPNGRKILVDTSVIKGSRQRSVWFNPRKGEKIREEEYERSDSREFLPPSQNQDWVLIIEGIADEKDVAAKGEGALI